MSPITDEFATPEFIDTNKEFFDRYIDLRVHGYDTKYAFLNVFGGAHWEENQQGYRRIDAIESTPYYMEQFKDRLAKIPASELWNDKKALNALLVNVRSPYIKDSVRLAAIKELNILVGIVIVDENGKTRAGRKLEDFYAEVEGDTKTEAKAEQTDQDAE